MQQNKIQLQNKRNNNKALRKKDEINVTAEVELSWVLKDRQDFNGKKLEWQMYFWPEEI